GSVVDGPAADGATVANGAVASRVAASGVVANGAVNSGAGGVDASAVNGSAVDGSAVDGAAADGATVANGAVASRVAASGVANGAVSSGPGGAAAGGDAGAGRQRGHTDVPPSHLVRIALVLTTAGLALHLTGVVTRGLAVHRVPWGDMYEFVISVSCVAVLFFLGLMIKYRPYHLGLFFMAPIVIIMGLAQTVIYTPAGPLVPALNSYWLAIHVTAMTLASGTFMVGAVLAVVYLFAERHTRRVAAGLGSRYGEVFRLLPTAERIDQIAYRTVVFAFPIWTFGIMAGAIWADQAWGRYWGWDPTETWAFITWVVYACFLHARVTAGWRGRRAAIIQLVGFGCLLFNLLGVSLFITGLHSYAGLS
ncbi:MAG TPA: c-type cytochrome biogenesis protein CcsB, partial [Streptosporangiaceae bacterium]|nr:c-type cytochrome biogenesis protein CcsB [Streptosporangiaceae bacterium]